MRTFNKNSNSPKLYSTSAIIIAIASLLWALIAFAPAPQNADQFRAQAESIESFPEEFGDYARYPNRYPVSKDDWTRLTAHCNYDLSARLDKQAAQTAQSTSQEMASQQTESYEANSKNAEGNRPSRSSKSAARTAWCQYAADAFLSPNEKLKLAAHQTMIEFHEFASFVGLTKSAGSERTSGVADSFQSSTSDESSRAMKSQTDSGEMTSGIDLGTQSESKEAHSN